MGKRFITLLADQDGDLCLEGRALDTVSLSRSLLLHLQDGSREPLCGVVVGWKTPSYRTFGCFQPGSSYKVCAVCAALEEAIAEVAKS